MSRHAAGEMSVFYQQQTFSVGNDEDSERKGAIGPKMVLRRSIPGRLCVGHTGKCTKIMSTCRTYRGWCRTCASTIMRTKLFPIRRAAP